CCPPMRSYAPRAHRQRPLKLQKIAKNRTWPSWPGHPWA
ncbi:hypothetical protein, partial [Pseudomonas sp. FEN]